MEDKLVETAEWPFVAFSTTSTTTLDPFDKPGQDGIMPELVGGSHQYYHFDAQTQDSIHIYTCVTQKNTFQMEHQVGLCVY
jgi:hypothetical protein